MVFELGRPEFRVSLLVCKVSGGIIFTNLGILSTPRRWHSPDMTGVSNLVESDILFGHLGAIQTVKEARSSRVSEKRPVSHSVLQQILIKTNIIK